MPKTGQWYGPRLREAMEAEGITDIQLAAAVGLKTPDTIGNWTKAPDEAGATEPRASQLGAVSEAVGRSISWLLGKETQAKAAS